MGKVSDRRSSTSESKDRSKEQFRSTQSKLDRKTTFENVISQLQAPEYDRGVDRDSLVKCFVSIYNWLAQDKNSQIMLPNPVGRSPDIRSFMWPEGAVVRSRTASSVTSTSDAGDALVVRQRRAGSAASLTYSDTVGRYRNIPVRIASEEDDIGFQYMRTQRTVEQTRPTQRPVEQTRPQQVRHHQASLDDDAEPRRTEGRDRRDDDDLPTTRVQRRDSFRPNKSFASLIESSADVSDGELLASPAMAPQGVRTRQVRLGAARMPRGNERRPVVFAEDE